MGEVILGLVFILDLINVLLLEIVVRDGLVLNIGMGGWVIRFLVLIVLMFKMLLLRFCCECFGFVVELIVMCCKFGIVLFFLCEIFLVLGFGVGGGLLYIVFCVDFKSFVFLDW